MSNDNDKRAEADTYRTWDVCCIDARAFLSLRMRITYCWRSWTFWRLKYGGFHA